MTTLKPLNKKEQNRLDELENQALSTFADKMDFNVDDWLDGKDQKEWRQLANREWGEEVFTKDETQ